MRAGRRRALAELFPAFRLDVEEGMRIDPATLFAEPVERLWIEIGFGSGEHLETLAAADPATGIVGAEPFLAGVARLLTAVEARGLSNVRIVADDARILLDALPDASVDRIFVMFPDPWPKVRHHKRRVVSEQNARSFVRVLRPGGELRCATDDRSYQHWMLDVLLRTPGLEWTARRADDWRVRPADQPPTRYEEKAIRAGRPPLYLRFQRSGETACGRDAERA